MPKCKIRGCKKITQYKKTKNPYCSMHLARIRRHGYPERKRDAYQSLEKLPHTYIDNFILKNHRKIIDKDIVNYLQKKGYKNATTWNIRYRRRKLGIKKYLYGEIQKHKEWIRRQTIKKYGDACELCGYNLAIETHHIVPKHKGGNHEIDNLIVVCSNCHGLITKKKIELKDRKSIKNLSRKVRKLIKTAYPYLG